MYGKAGRHVFASREELDAAVERGKSFEARLGFEVSRTLGPLGMPGQIWFRRPSGHSVVTFYDASTRYPHHAEFGAVYYADVVVSTRAKMPGAVFDVERLAREAIAYLAHCVNGPREKSPNMVSMAEHAMVADSAMQRGDFEAEALALRKAFQLALALLDGDEGGKTDD